MTNSARDLLMVYNETLRRIQDSGLKEGLGYWQLNRGHAWAILRELAVDEDATDWQRQLLFEAQLSGLEAVRDRMGPFGHRVGAFSDDPTLLVLRGEKC